MGFEPTTSSLGSWTSIQPPAAEMIAALEEQGMQAHMVIYERFSYLKQITSLRPNIKVMPESVTAEICKS